MSLQPVVFPDAVETVADYLNTVMPSVPTHRRVPAIRPGAWLRIIRTGGVRNTVVTDAAQITIEAWANDAGVAADLAQLTRAWLHASVGVICYGVDELGGPADLPDIESQQQRYTFTLIIHLRGTTV